MIPSMQGLVEDSMYVSQGEMIMSGGDSDQGIGTVPIAWTYLAVHSTKRQLSLRTKNLTAKTLSLNKGGQFVLAILSNRIHQVNLRSLCGPFFFSSWKMKPGDDYWTCTWAISLPVIVVYYYGLGKFPNSSVVWKSSGPCQISVVSIIRV